MKFEMNKRNIIIVVSVVGLLLVILIMLLFNNNSKSDLLDTNKEIAKDVFYDEGSSDFIGDLKPTDNYCGGIRKTISLNKKTDGDLIATVSMKLNDIDKMIFESPDVYWVVTIGDDNNCSGRLEEAMNYGTFIGRNNGEELILLQNISVLKEEQKYSLWIWIDKKGKDVSLLSNKKVDIDIFTKIDKLKNVEN